ncbi:MAG: hypothetical protein B6I30_04560 [Desulfobacteraceae bacterium 4572_187]|nr:MAG: hypothetical protein B6I30_04560 [Desulfobacteraceae bacterium 4572_187]
MKTLFTLSGRGRFQYKKHPDGELIVYHIQLTWSWMLLKNIQKSQWVLHGTIPLKGLLAC